MNYFEQELRRLFGNEANITDKRRSGGRARTAIVRPDRQENGQQPKLQGWHHPVYMEVRGQNRVVCLQADKS